MLAGMYRGPGRDIAAWNSGLLYDMIYTQPVFYELGQLTMPVLLMTGDKDTTAIGKNLTPPSIRPTLGNYPALGKAAARIPHAHPVEFPDLGHAPQVQAHGTMSTFRMDFFTGLAPHEQMRVHRIAVAIPFRCELTSSCTTMGKI